MARTTRRRVSRSSPSRSRKAKHPGWGGRRPGAGRKPKGEVAGVSHRPRPALRRTLPIHVTLKMAPHVWKLRSRRAFRVVREALRASADRFAVRVVRFSVEDDRLHVLVEASSRVALARAMKGLSVRLARGLNAMMGTKGRVVADRYQAEVLATAADVRRALASMRAGSGSPALGFALPAPATRLGRAG